MENNYTVSVMNTLDVFVEKDFTNLVDAIGFYEWIGLDEKTNVCKVVWDKKAQRVIIDKGTAIYDALMMGKKREIERLKLTGHNGYLSIYKLPEGL